MNKKSNKENKTKEIFDEEEIRYYITKQHVLRKNRNKKIFYYELRHYDNNERFFVIEKEDVIVNFYGTLISSKEILRNREYMDQKEFKKLYKLVKDKTLYKEEQCKV